jgi:hypothetical protein
MVFDTRNKNIYMYGLGVGISTGFEKLGRFLFKGVRPPCMTMTYTLPDAT